MNLFDKREKKEFIVMPSVNVLLSKAKSVNRVSSKCMYNNL